MNAKKGGGWLPSGPSRRINFWSKGITRGQTYIVDIDVCFVRMHVWVYSFFSPQHVLANTFILIGILILMSVFLRPRLGTSFRYLEWCHTAHRKNFRSTWKKIFASKTNFFRSYFKHEIFEKCKFWVERSASEIVFMSPMTSFKVSKRFA